MTGSVGVAVAVFAEVKTHQLHLRYHRLQRTIGQIQQDNENLRQQYLHLLQATNETPLSEKMIRLRKMVIDHGLPEETPEEKENYATKCSLRGMIWKILLGALKMDAERYCQLVELGPCTDDKKIRNDTFRTYKNNELFWSRVDESKLSRVLTVCSRAYSETLSPKASASVAPKATYVQGMNVLVAPFLYLMPEIDAYTAFMTLITRHCPRYVVSNLDGVHHGCSLVDRTLEILDPQLHRHILEKIIRPEIFAFPYIMTLLANMSPLSEVIRLWDAIFAFGIHFDILLVTCHLMLMRDQLLAEQQAFRIQKMIVQEPLDSELLIACTLQMVKFLPASLFEELISHPVEKPKNISQVLSRDYQLTSRSLDDDDDKSVSSQGAGKTKRRPLSGRLSKRTLGSPNDVAGTNSNLVSKEENERGMKRTASNGKPKVRPRSRSRSRGRSKNRTLTSGEDVPAEVLPIPRRVRVHSTSRITTEKSSLSATSHNSSDTGHHVEAPHPHSPRGSANTRGHKSMTLSSPVLHLHPEHQPLKGTPDHSHAETSHHSPPKGSKPKSPAPWK